MATVHPLARPLSLIADRLHAADRDRGKAVAAGGSAVGEDGVQALLAQQQVAARC